MQTKAAHEAGIIRECEAIRQSNGKRKQVEPRQKKQKEPSRKPSGEAYAANRRAPARVTVTNSCTSNNPALKYIKRKTKAQCVAT